MLRDWTELCGLFNAHGVEYLLVGGQAVIAHGYPRLTRDMDLWVRPAAANGARVLQALIQFGAPPAGIPPQQFEDPRTLLMIGREPFRVDIPTDLPGVTFDDAWPARTHVTIDGVTVPVIGKAQPITNAHAWHEGVRRLDDAIAGSYDHALETTLGGQTIAARIAEAVRTHDVVIWFCVLASSEQHIARVRLRVAAGGHDIPEGRIRERYPRALRNLIGLMPVVVHFHVYDNSADVAPGVSIPDPVLVLEMVEGRLTRPDAGDVPALQRTPDWAKPLLEAALQTCFSQP